MTGLLYTNRVQTERYETFSSLHDHTRPVNEGTTLLRSVPTTVLNVQTIQRNAMKWRRVVAGRLTRTKHAYVRRRSHWTPHCWDGVLKHLRQQTQRTYFLTKMEIASSLQPHLTYGQSLRSGCDSTLQTKDIHRNAFLVINVFFFCINRL